MLVMQNQSFVPKDVDSAIEPPDSTSNNKLLMKRHFDQSFVVVSWSFIQENWMMYLNVIFVHVLVVKRGAGAFCLW